MLTTDTDFDTKVTLETEMSNLADEDTPFNILFLGNWSGKDAQSSLTDVFPLRPVEIDRDNFDVVMKKFHIGLNLDFVDSQSSLRLEFAEFDDFHPDRIFQQVSLFSDLRDIRRKLSNSNTYNEAAREVRSWLKNDNDKNPDNIERLDSSAASVDPVSDSLLDQILGQSASENSASPKPNTAASELSEFVGKLVRPHLIHTDVEEQSNLLMIVDELTSDMMRRILHHPKFKALESAWRSAYLLVRKIETDSHLKIFLLDIDKATLAADLKSGDDLTESRTYRAFVESDKNWAIIGGNYDFSLNIDDVAVLVRLAKIGHNINAPFVSYIEPEMFGIKSFDLFSPSDKLQIAENSIPAKLWSTLRSVTEASHLGLATPRFLSRLPYGAKTEPTETFYFEEFTETTEHEKFLWANPAFACVLLLAQSYSESGWELSTNLIQNIDSLPLYFYQQDSETKSKSCAEIFMTQNNAEILIEQGLMPLIAFRDTDRVRVGRFQSILPTGSMLSGKWS